jgi:hypothetical protein
VNMRPPQTGVESQEALGDSPVRFECGAATCPDKEVQTRSTCLPESRGAFRRGARLLTPHRQRDNIRS